MVKKRYNLEDALSDLKKRQDLFNKSNNTISGLFKAINDNFTCMSITLPEDKKKILEHPDKPKFLEGNVKRIQEGWDDTKKKAQDRLKLLQDTKEAWVGYAENNETIAAQFEVAEEEIKLVKKRYNLEDALSDMKKRQDLYNKSNDTISGLFKAIND